MLDWLRRILGPPLETEYKCETCEVLKEQITHERYEKERLLKYILETPPERTHVERNNEMEEPEPIKPKIIPWNIQRQMLEAEDRKQAQLLREQKENTAQAIAELEKNLGVVSETSLDLENGNVQGKSI